MTLLHLRKRKATVPLYFFTKMLPVACKTAADAAKSTTIFHGAFPCFYPDQPASTFHKTHLHACGQIEVILIIRGAEISVHTYITLGVISRRTLAGEGKKDSE